MIVHFLNTTKAYIVTLRISNSNSLVSIIFVVILGIAIQNLVTFF